MKSLFLLELAVLLSVRALPSNVQPSSVIEEFIVGGEYAKPGEFPWQLSLQIMGYPEKAFSEVWTHTCGAILYSSKYALTYAHCLYSGNTYRIVAGLHKLSEPNLATIVDIRSFEKHNHNNIAIITFASEIGYTEWIKPAVLPSDNNNRFDNESCFISGWGKSSLTGRPDTLRKGLMSVITNSECQIRIGDWPIAGLNTICALDPKEYTSICHYDEGGPMTCKIGGKDIVVGLASEFFLGYIKECTPKKPSLYVRLSEYLDWIKQNTP
ncbi:hypothetical protein HELRODRAFT_191905 [Helobdella robusta]|uniref:Peptidase S1 domain-containing protein n=1 Tax=Helobdella robusta TaxID=6412 RepID=T1FTE5_HELRO|nr:hypothetical protein HELRODRAFT_191905 [Helobdella robusta]ESO03651.1 hypothetical protein HELRODRAFT_191905 [Helobdella robusta]